MKIIKNLLNNVVILALLLILGVGLVMFLSSRSQDNVTAQAPDTKPTAAQDQKKPTPKPDPGQKPTLTPTIDTTVPEDDQPEPTWTPKVILPEGTPPPLPSPPPTFTPTPVNLNESVLYSFDKQAFIGEISPDGKTLAFMFEAPRDDENPNPYQQLWLMDISSKEMTMLAKRGSRPRWSKDGRKILYTGGKGWDTETRVIDVDGRNDTLLFAEGVLDYYWSDDGKISLVRLGSIDKVSVDGREAVDKRPVDSIKSVPSGNNPEVDAASNDTLLLVDYDPGFLSERLRVVLPDGQERTIDTEHAAHSRFALSPNGKLIAYVAGPRESHLSGNSFWISDLSGERQKKILDLIGSIDTRGGILDPVWSPDGKSIIIILTEYGTNPNYRLAKVDVESGKVSELGVDEVDYRPIFSPDGKYIYYTRTIEHDFSLNETTFYQLRLE